MLDGKFEGARDAPWVLADLERDRSVIGAVYSGELQSSVSLLVANLRETPPLLLVQLEQVRAAMFRSIMLSSTWSGASKAAATANEVYPTSTKKSSTTARVVPSCLMRASALVQDLRQQSTCSGRSSSECAGEEVAWKPIQRSEREGALWSTVRVANWLRGNGTISRRSHHRKRAL